MISYASVSTDEGHIKLEVEKISKYDRTPEQDGNVETFDVDASEIIKQSNINVEQGDVISVIADGEILLGILKKEDEEKNRRAEIIEELMNSIR